MNTLTKIQRIKIYRENEKFWNTKLRQKFSERDADITIEYLAGNMTYRELGKKHSIKPERIRQIFIKSLYYIAKISKRAPYQELAKETPPKLETFDDPYIFSPREGSYNTVVSEEEYGKIKELIFRGEDVKTIASLSKRSNSIVFRIRQSANYTEYRGQPYLWRKKAQGGKQQEEQENAEQLPPAATPSNAVFNFPDEEDKGFVHNITLTVSVAAAVHAISKKRGLSITKTVNILLEPAIKAYKEQYKDTVFDIDK